MKCPCGCSNGPASSWYHGLQKCSSGTPTKQEWLDTFKVTEIVKAVKAKKETKKKGTAESSSKATTPTKDGDSADKDSSDEEAKEKKSSKKQKVEKEPKTPKAKKEKPAEDGEPKEKRPQSAYFLLLEAKRAEAKEADASKTLNVKELGEMWKALSEEEKEPYTSKAAAAKAEYDSKKQPTENQKKKAAKAEGPPKARSAYLIFNSEERTKILEEFPGIKASEVMKLQGARWKELSPEDKKVYEDKAKAEKEVCVMYACMCVYTTDVNIVQ